MPATSIRDRVVLADALRGFALMGLFIVHMVEYFELYWYKPEPGWIHNVVFFLFGGKAYGIFALLFGFSFYIILDNYQKRGYDFRLRFLWRVLILLIIGYLHSLLYAGDILQLLATGGILLLLSNRLSTRLLWFFSAFLLLQCPTWIAAFFHFVLPTTGYESPYFNSLMQENFEVFAKGSLSELIQYNILSGQKGKWMFFIETGRLWNIYGLMLLGLILGRIEFFEKRQPIAKLYTLLASGIGLFFISKGLLWLSANVKTSGMSIWLIEQGFQYYQNLAIIIIGIVFFTLLFYTNTCRKPLSIFAPAGRLTLSLYLLQSLIFVPCYYGFGLAWYQSLGQAGSLGVGLTVCVIQLVISYFYLQHFRYGPMESLWRKTTLIGYAKQEN